MKIFNNIHIKGSLRIAFLSLLALSCNDDAEIDYNEDKAITQQISNPYLQVTTSFVPFKPGSAEYKIGFNVINGVKEINKVNVYTTFKDAKSGEFSNERLIGTYNITSAYRTVVTDNLTYAELKEGLTVDGAALPANDADIAPGSSWSFRFEGITTTGSDLSLLGTINMVFSKYAGNYKVIDASYYRIGVLTAQWAGEERFIGHVDDVTLSYNDHWGSFAWAGASFNFTVDPTTQAITVPILTASGLFGGTRAIGCKTDKAVFKSVPCDGSNKLVEDPIAGKHKIYLTYGYFTDGSGPREFYEVLEKIVN